MSAHDVELPEGFDFLDSFKTLASQVSDVSDDFVEAGVQFLTQNTAERDYVIMSRYEAPFFVEPPEEPSQWGPMYLNTPYVIMGKSRITRKTWLTRRINEAVSKLNQGSILANSFSPESMIDELSEKYNEVSNSTIGTLIVDDCGGYFEGLKKDYMAGLLPTLSSILSGQDYKRRTRAMKGSSSWIRNPYLTIWMNGTLDLPKKFHKGWFEQGYANRHLYVFGQRKTKPANGIDKDGEKIQSQLLPYLKKLQRPSSTVILVRDHDVENLRLKMIDQLERRIDKEELGIKESWVANRPEFIDKVAAVRRLCHISNDVFAKVERRELPNLRISMDDYSYAVSWIDKCEGWVDRVIEKMGEPESEKDRTSEDRIERVYRYIKEAGRDGLQRQFLYRRAKMDSKSLETIIDTLHAGRRISEERKPTRGDTAIVYRALD